MLAFPIPISVKLSFTLARTWNMRKDSSCFRNNKNVSYAPWPNFRPMIFYAVLKMARYFHEFLLDIDLICGVRIYLKGYLKLTDLRPIDMFVKNILNFDMEKRQRSQCFANYSQAHAWLRHVFVLCKTTVKIGWFF